MDLQTKPTFVFNYKRFNYELSESNINPEIVINELDITADEFYAVTSGKEQPSLDLYLNMSAFLQLFDNELIINSDFETCWKCGCTNVNACCGGCHWVESDLCSNCNE